MKAFQKIVVLFYKGNLNFEFGDKNPGVASVA